MARARQNHDRESRIHEEIIVDAYGPEEQAMSWYYYLEDKLRFPFRAQCATSVPTSPLRKGDTVEIRKMAPEGSCASDMLVMTRWKNRNIAVPLSQLKALDVDKSTNQPSDRRLALLGGPWVLLLIYTPRVVLQQVRI